MRHFLGSSVPVVGLTAGMLTGAAGRALIAGACGPQRCRSGKWRTVSTIAVTPVARRAKVDLLPASLAKEETTRCLTHPASAAMRDWTAVAGPAMLRGSRPFTRR
jgi:hypothetical protein